MDSKILTKCLLILMLYYRAAAADTRLRAQNTASAGGMREQQRNIIFLRVAKAYCARYIFLLKSATLFLKEYNGFRGSICVTGMNISSKTFRYSCKHGRFSVLCWSCRFRGLCEAKPDERLSNISHTIQTYVETRLLL